MLDPRSPLVALGSLVWPVECGGCGLPDVALCRACAAALCPPSLAGPWTPVVTSVLTCPPTWSPLAYSGPVREAVVAWKDHGRLDLGSRLAPPLTAATAQVLRLLRALVGSGGALRPDGGPPGSVLLVPVPSAPAAVRRRGQDVVAVLAGLVARQLRRSGHDVVRRSALRLVRRVSDQVGLSALERSHNLAGALSAVSSSSSAAAGLVGRWCVLLDDVVTTGASLAEARRALEAAGARVAAAATIAATPRRL